MGKPISVFRAASGLAAALTLALPVAAQTPALALLERLERGQWQLRDRDSSAPPRLMCITDARAFLQLHHPGAQCSRYVVEDTAGSVTVQYTCSGGGSGRTTVVRETDRLVQIDTQGVARGAPFADSIEARRVGSCT